MNENIAIVSKDQGEHLSVAGNEYRILISGRQTEGAYAVIDMMVPPGGGPGPHAHPDMQEMFFVVDGEVEFKTEAGKYVAGKGTFVNIPKGGEIHCFKNNSGAMAHLLCTVVPAGLDEMFQELVLMGDPGSEGFKEKLQALAEKYGQRFYPPDYLG